MINMTEEDLQKLKDHLDRAVVIGRTNTSDLADMIMHRMESGIDKYVNGKIDKLLVMQESQNSHLQEILTEQSRVKEELSKLKADTTPLVDNQKVLTGLGRFIMWIGAIILIIAGVLKLIK